MKNGFSILQLGYLFSPTSLPKQGRSKYKKSRSKHAQEEEATPTVGPCEGRGAQLDTRHREECVFLLDEISVLPAQDMEQI